MRFGRLPYLVALVVSLAGCGGGGGSSSGSPSAGTPTPTPTPTPTATSSPTACTLSARQQWALAQLQEWYLFPDQLDTTVRPADYSTVQDYIDALVAPARDQSKDRYFTYVTSIAEENAYFERGDVAGLGVLLNFDSENRLMVGEAIEGSPALAAGIDRGTEIVAIGTSTANLQSVESLLASGGERAVAYALGPSTAGTRRVFQIRQPDSSVMTVSVTAAAYTLAPVSARYGAKVIQDNGRKVGYLNLRTFVDTADPALRTAFADFRAQGVSELIVDLRYNGGGLISIAELLSDLLNGQRAGQVQNYTTFRPSKASNNETTRFTAQPEAIAAARIAFIGTGSTASASELVINAQKPYLPAGMALVGSNTYGKPVGQVGLDNAPCDDRLRVVALKTENADHEGDYYTGLAGEIPNTCRAEDDLSHPLGDPAEASIKAALDFLDGRACTPIAAAAFAARSAPGRRPLQATNPTAVQRDLPGIH